MKKTSFLFAMLLTLGMATKLSAEVVTTESTAGSPITANELKQLSGTGAHFALVPVSTNSTTANKWFGKSANLTAEYVWTLTDTLDGYYNISRLSDNKFIQDNTTLSWGDATNVANLSVVYSAAYSNNAVEATNYDSNYHIQFHKDGSTSLRMNCVNNNFGSGQGGWATYVAYGPLYVINVVEVDQDNVEIGTEKIFITKGTTTINAPEVANYTAQEATVTTQGTTDENITIKYTIADKNTILSNAKALISYGAPKAEVETLLAAIKTFEDIDEPTLENQKTLLTAEETYQANIAASTSNELYLPTGYYYFKGMATNRGPYLYSDFVNRGNTSTTHADSYTDKNNKYVWHIENKGITITATNGEGLQVTTSSDAAGTVLTAQETLTFGNYSSAYEGIYFTEAINLTTSTYNGYIVTWTDGGSNPSDNRWTFEDVDVSEGVYNVVIEGNDNGYVTYSGQNAKNGGFFVAASISENDLTANATSRWETTIVITDKTIKVTYEQKDPDWDGLQTAYNNLAAYTIGTGLGQYTETGSEVSTKLSTAKTYLDSKSNTIEEVDTLITELQTLLTNKSSYLTLNLPKEGMYLRVQGGYTNKYLTSDGVSDNSNILLKEDNTNAESIFYYDGASLINYATGKGLTSTSLQCAAGNTIDQQTFAEGATAGTYTMRSNSSASQWLYDNHSPLRLDRNSSINTEHCKWILEEVTELPFTTTAYQQYTGKDESYGTLYLPVAVQLTQSDTHVYGAKLSDDGNYLKGIELTEADGVITIPAKEGVIIQSTNANTNFTLKVTTTEETVDGNELTGSYQALASAPENIYVFSAAGETGSMTAGFYRYAGSTMKVNRAYYQADETESAKMLGFDLTGDTETAIKGIVFDNDTDDIYDLTGRKVKEVRKGIYVKNGHKYLVK